MIKNILKQEEEFFKLNEEIDLKTKDLLNEVDQIKKNRLRNDKSYSGWSVSDPITQVETIEKEHENHLDTSSKSSEHNFALSEYYSRRKDEDSLNFVTAEDLSSQKTETDLNKGKTRRNAKLSHSAKVTPSLVSAQGQESGLALGITRHKSDVKSKQEVSENEVIPETLKGVGHDGITRFLSAKVKLLSEQLDIMQKDEKKHLMKIKELQAQKDKAVAEREKLLHQANMTKNILVKYEKHAENIAAQLQAAQAENNHLKKVLLVKELETLKKEIRQNSKNHSANEIKLNRTLEENERLKSSLQQAKQEEKELKELQRKKTEDLSNAVKTLDRQKAELLNGFKKQLLIIDNLKRQKGLLEAGKLLKSAEDDFMNFLDCNPPNAVRRTASIRSAKS